MKILFSFLPNQEQQDKLLEEFPDVEFIFHKGLNEELVKVSGISSYIWGRHRIASS